MKSSSWGPAPRKLPAWTSARSAAPATSMRARNSLLGERILGIPAQALEHEELDVLHPHVVRRERGEHEPAPAFEKTCAHDVETQEAHERIDHEVPDVRATPALECAARHRGRVLVDLLQVVLERPVRLVQELAAQPT